MARPVAWPTVRVLMLGHPRAAGEDAEARRASARRRVRDAFAAHADPAVAAAFIAAPRALRGAGRVSVTHEREVSLVAWCERGCIGIDIVDAERSLAADAADVATLYLGAEVAAGVGRDRLRFAQAWARHEARLKCLGLELDEWEALPHAALARCEVAQVRLGDPGRVAWVAWTSAVRS